MTETDDTTVQDRSGDVLSKGIDWVVTAVLVLGGLLVGLGGLFVNGLANRADIARLVADGTIESGALSDAELVDVTYALAWWGGAGLAAIGLLLVLGGIVYLLYRRRVRARRAEMGITGPDTTTNAIVGAVVTVVTAFVPLSPILGGAVAGYLQDSDRADGAKVGGLSGLVASLPIVLLFTFVVGGLLVVSTELSFGIGGGLVALVLLIALFVTVLYTIGLSALGGYIGVYLREDETSF